MKPASKDRNAATSNVNPSIAADELGLRAEEEPHHVNDVHASILYLLGLDHLKTTYMRNGRAERPTVTGGKLITKLWA